MDEVKAILSAVLEGQERLAAEIKGFRAEMKSEIAAIRQDIAELKQCVAEIQGKVEELDDSFDLLARRAFDTRVRVKRIEKKVE